MMAVILAGGKGTRLAPYTVAIPKPLMPLGDKPILEIVVRQLRACGVDRMVLSLGHMSYFFLSFIERWRAEGLSVEYCTEERPMGTAGSLALVDDLEDDFLVLNGDVLTTLDFSALMQAHEERHAWGTIAVSRREHKVDYGVVRMTEALMLADYEEKPVLTYDVSMGINALSRRSLEFVPAGRRFDLPELMNAMRQAGKPVLCYPTDCYWQDIGRVEDLQQASADFLEDPTRFFPDR